MAHYNGITEDLSSLTHDLLSLKNNLADIRAEISSLSKDLRSESRKQMKVARKELKRSAAVGLESLREAADTGRHAIDGVKKEFHRRPVRTALTAIALGLFLGKLLRRGA